MSANIKRAGFRESVDRTAPKGWHVETVQGRGNPAQLIVRDGFRAEACTGEAHSNAYIDHCMRCLSHVWGFVAVEDKL